MESEEKKRRSEVTFHQFVCCCWNLFPRLKRTMWLSLLIILPLVCWRRPSRSQESQEQEVRVTGASPAAVSVTSTWVKTLTTPPDLWPALREDQAQVSCAGHQRVEPAWRPVLWPVTTVMKAPVVSAVSHQTPAPSPRWGEVWVYPMLTLSVRGWSWRPAVSTAVIIMTECPAPVRTSSLTRKDSSAALDWDTEWSIIMVDQKWRISRKQFPVYSVRNTAELSIIVQHSHHHHLVPRKTSSNFPQLSDRNWSPQILVTELSLPSLLLVMMLKKMMMMMMTVSLHITLLHYQSQTIQNQKLLTSPPGTFQSEWNTFEIKVKYFSVLREWRTRVGTGDLCQARLLREFSHLNLTEASWCETPVIITTSSVSHSNSTVSSDTSGSSMIRETSASEASLASRATQLLTSLRMLLNTPDLADTCSFFTDDRWELKHNLEDYFTVKYFVRFLVPWEFSYFIQCQGSREFKVCNTCAGTFNCSLAL